MSKPLPGAGLVAGRASAAGPVFRSPLPVEVETTTTAQQLYNLIFIIIFNVFNSFYCIHLFMHSFLIFNV